MVAHGTPCLGPVTHAGCGALCPAYDRGCYGCFGPMETPNTVSLTQQLQVLGMGDRGVDRASSARSTSRPSRSARDRWPELATKTIKTDYLARVEGEGAMLVKIADGRVEEVKLNIYEPPRFFEAFLRGRAFTEAPDITARICGICPVAYQMSACHAMEDACGVEVDGQLRAAAAAALLRRVDREPRAARLHAPRCPTSSATRARSSSPETTRTRSRRRSS